MRAVQNGCGYLFAPDTIRKGDDYRTPVIPAVPAVFLSRDCRNDDSRKCQISLMPFLKCFRRRPHGEGFEVMRHAGMAVRNRR
jgi:hypothetical protein